jgi:hypothetical protein
MTLLIGWCVVVDAVVGPVTIQLSAAARTARAGTWKRRDRVKDMACTLRKRLVTKGRRTSRR